MTISSKYVCFMTVAGVLWRTFAFTPNFCYHFIT